MQKQANNKSVLIIAIMIVVAALTRLLPHPPNVAPIGAMALFGAAYFQRKYLAVIIPFAALWISSLLLNNLVYGMYYEGFVWFSHPGVYLAFLAIVMLGFGLLKKVTFGRVFGATIAASVLFFVVTNFFSWLELPFYTKDLAGLIECYTAAIPFFWNTLGGDAFFVTVLFGGYELIRQQYLEVERV